ncbi:hypothetical protein EDC94DRAFT_635351 [Helicostylum pulchrum]|nr:hypothetical protein EDC94DRAFT_635351 [Helicostylum pulchrum]
MFQELQTSYPKLLLLVTSGIRSSEGALRRACIECCQLFIHCSQGYQWLLNNKQATSFITFAILDQSNYVVAEACRLFSTLLTLHDRSLLDVMDPSSLIISILHPQCDEKQIISALDFCWEIVNIKAVDYMREKKLLHPVIQLLCSTNRIIRSRVLEIISVLFTWDTDPLRTLGLEDTTNTVDTAYEKFVFISNTMISQAMKMDDLMTAVSLLDTSLLLLSRSSSVQDKLPTGILFSLFDACFLDLVHDEYKNVKSLVKTARSKNNLLQIILKSMDKLVSIEPEIMVRDHRFTQIFNILSNSVFYSDARVLKSCLTLLETSLYNHKQPELLTKSIRSLVDMMDESDCKSLVIILEAIDNLLSRDQIGTLLTECSVSGTLVEALNNKLFDTEWNIRDVVINFVGQLFKEPWSKAKIQFALNFDLPLRVFDRILDNEAYVRASALQVLTSMIKCKEGWCYIQKDETMKLVESLPSLLHDDEAFVRRAALDCINCLVGYQSGQGIKIEYSESKDSLK